MKLYEVPRNTDIELLDGTQLRFERLDGAYSVCRDESGEVIHLAAWTEVDIVGADK